MCVVYECLCILILSWFIYPVAFVIAIRNKRTRNKRTIIKRNATYFLIQVCNTGWWPGVVGSAFGFKQRS